MNTLRIYTDFEFGYNSYSYTRIWPRQIQSYKVHANYRPRPWATIDGAIDIHENRDNVSQVNNLEHGRTYSLSTVLAPNSKLSFTLGYNYTDLYLQTYVCFNDGFGSMTNGLESGPVIPSRIQGHAPSAIARVRITSGGNGVLFQQAALRLQRRDVETDEASYNDPRIQRNICAGAMNRGSTLFLNPLQPGGTIAFNYHKPFASVQVDIYKGLT